MIKDKLKTISRYSFIISLILTFFILQRVAFAEKISSEALNKIMLKASADRSLLDCALWIIETQKDYCITSPMRMDCLREGSTEKWKLLQNVSLEYARLRQFDAAKKFIPRSVFSADTLEILSALAKAYASSGDFDDALKLYETIAQGAGVKINEKQHDEIATSTLVDIADAYSERGEYTEAIKLLERAMKGIENLEAYQQNSSYIKIAKGYWKAKKQKQAIQILKQAFNKSTNSYLYDLEGQIKIEECLSDIGEKADALKMLDIINERLKSFTFELQVSLVGKTVSSYDRLGEVNKANDLFFQILYNINAEKNENYRAKLYYDFSYDYIASGEHARLLDSLKAMEASFPYLKKFDKETLKKSKIKFFSNDNPVYADEKINTYAEVYRYYEFLKKYWTEKAALAYAQQGKFEKARLLIKELSIENKGLLDVLEAMALTYARSGEKEKAAAALLEAVNYVSLKKDSPYFVAESLIELAGIYREAGVGINKNVTACLKSIVDYYERNRGL